jgi:hypothetical protein
VEESLRHEFVSISSLYGAVLVACCQWAEDAVVIRNVVDLTVTCYTYGRILQST